MKKIYFILSFIILLTITIRIVIGEPCSVPSNSMENTIHRGDWLWIDKLTYGGLLPQRTSEIPLVNIFTWIKPLRELDSNSSWGYHRISGIRKPAYSDIIVFRDTHNTTKLLVKRLVGLPGDTIQIKKGVVFVNNISDKILPNIIVSNLNDTTSASFSNGKKCTINDFGPVVIPEKHYFVLGDNRSNSIDSRFLGFIPAQNIIGKVNCVLFSIDEFKPFWKKWRWNRFIDLIN